MLIKAFSSLLIFTIFIIVLHFVSWRQVCTYNNPTLILHQSVYDRNESTTQTPTTTIPLKYRRNYYLNGSLERNILIYAKYRTGSTFISEIFNQNEHFFFLFEPMKLVASSSLFVENVNKWLDLLFSCKFTEIWEGGLRNDHHTHESLLGWKKKIFCYKLDQTDTCQAYSMHELENLCRLYPFKAIKDIHFQHIQTIIPAIKKGLPVVYVVRDPRGVISSQMNVYWGLNRTISIDKFIIYREQIVSWIDSYCSEMTIDLPIVQKLLSQKLSNNFKSFKVVRYEDFVLDSKSMTIEMYDMVKTVPSKKVTNWLTETYGRSSADDVNELTFGTQRKNVYRPVFSWRSHLWWQIIDYIQVKCGKVMNSYGYRLLNKTNFDDMYLKTF